jgi:hypothetical protein
MVIQPFRTPSEPTTEPVSTPDKPVKPVTTGQTEGDTDSFMLYKADHHKPYLAEHYDLGESWDDPDGFIDEVDYIEGYFKELVENGMIDDNVSVIKKKIRNFEKMAGIDPTERTVVRLGKLKEYVKFLKETENLDKLITKYGKR